MFLIEYNGQQKIWGNKKQDDFLRFVPDQLGITKDQMVVYFVSEETEKWFKQPNRFLDFPIGTGTVQKKEVVNGQLTDVGTPQEMMQVQWPYDENGKFKGNVQE